ncbi:MAG: hypothetical protein AB7P37_01025 [Ramlibacter sp.]
MTTLAPRSLLATLGRHLVAALNAWSYAIARSRAERRRREAQAAQAAAATPVTPVNTPRWPTTWGD